MCRSIVNLRGEPVAEDWEVRNAALQYVRKISGFNKPSKANEAAFERAVDAIAHATQHLLEDLVIPAGSRPPAMAQSRIVAREKRAVAPAG